MAETSTNNVTEFGSMTKGGGEPSRPLVLHVTGDFPDPFEPSKTVVIRTLLDLTKDRIDHRVISINRQSPGNFALVSSVINPSSLMIERRPFAYGEAWRYRAPPRGLMHRTKLKQLGKAIAEHVDQTDRAPSLIIGHKLTIEGIAVRTAADILKVPYALSIQGNTDTRIIEARPDLRRRFAAIYHGARVVFPFTPWAQRQVENRLEKREEPTHLLPCPTDLDRPMKPIPDGDGLISVFHLRNHSIKNLSGIVAAYRRIAKRRSPPPLEIIGGGSAKDLAACQTITKDFPQITFAGAMGREQLLERMRRASALILPSRRESFGLVFVEALFAGIPVIYPQCTAIDGYFDDAPFALRVNATDPRSIAAAIERAVGAENELKSALEGWQNSARSEQFTRAHISEVFASGLLAAAEQ